MVEAVGQSAALARGLHRLPRRAGVPRGGGDSHLHRHIRHRCRLLLLDTPRLVAGETGLERTASRRPRHGCAVCVTGLGVFSSSRDRSCPATTTPGPISVMMILLSWLIRIAVCFYVAAAAAAAAAAAVVGRAWSERGAGASAITHSQGGASEQFGEATWMSAPSSSHSSSPYDTHCDHSRTHPFG